MSPKDFCGFNELTLEDDEVNSFLNGESTNTFGIKRNEYARLLDKSGTEIGIFKLTDKGFKRIKFMIANSKHGRKVKPRNPQQIMGLDMLFDEDTTIKVITGKFGTGKDYLMCAAAAELIEKGDFEKIVYVRNNIEVKDSKPIGYLPGGFNEKMLPFAMPLADHFGGVDELNYLIQSGVIEVVHLGFIRGRDIKNSIIICSEAENMTKEHIQLLIGRVGEGSALWLNGDFKQTDAEVFEKSSGLLTAIQKLRGHKRFAHVKLLKTERSETAAMADLLD